MKKVWIIIIVLVVIAAVLSIVINLVGEGPSQPGNEEFGGVFDSQGSDSVTITFRNTSEDLPIAPGMLVLHDGGFDLNFLDRQAPDEFEFLAEFGEPGRAIEYALNNPSVSSATTVGLIEPGDSQTIVLYPDEVSPDTRVSYMGMIIPTNDAVVWLNAYELFDEGGSPIEYNSLAEIVDLGFEQNSPVNSGFEGGQPDPVYGAENLNNGVEERQVVSFHPQFSSDDSVEEVLVVSIEFGP